MTPKDRFRILCRYWGCGNPDNARILFIGIEEGGDWSDKNIAKCKQDNETPDQTVDRLIEERKERFAARERCEKALREEKPKHTERMQAYLAMKLSGVSCTDPKEYYRDHFLRTEFQANVYPVGARNIGNWIENSRKFFDLVGSKSDYKKEVLNDRLQVLHELLRRMRRKDPLIFVMGKCIWNNPAVFDPMREKLFKGAEFVYDDASSKRYGWDKKKRRIWLLRHPSHCPEKAWRKYIDDILSVGLHL